MSTSAGDGGHGQGWESTTVERGNEAMNDEYRIEANIFFLYPGQHSKDSPHLLQGQGLQETHSTQGHPIQSWQGSSSILLQLL